jgi:RNase P subunit RPR2
MLQIFYKMKFKTILKEIKHYIPSKKNILKNEIIKIQIKIQAFSSSRCKACLWKNLKSNINITSSSASFHNALNQIPLINKLNTTPD